MASAPFAPNDIIPSNSYKYKHVLRLEHEVSKYYTEKQEYQRKVTELSEKVEEHVEKYKEVNTELIGKTLELDKRNREVLRLKAAAADDKHTIKRLRREIQKKDDKLRKLGSLHRYKEERNHFRDALDQERQNNRELKDKVKMQNIRLRELVDKLRDSCPSQERNELSSYDDELAVLNENVSIVIALMNKQRGVREEEKNERKLKLAGITRKLCKHLKSSVKIIEQLQEEEDLYPATNKVEEENKSGPAVGSSPIWTILEKKVEKSTCEIDAIVEPIQNSPSPPALTPFSPSVYRGEEGNDNPQSPNKQQGEEEGIREYGEYILECGQGRDKELEEGEIDDEDMEENLEKSCNDEQSGENVRDNDLLTNNDHDDFMDHDSDCVEIVNIDDSEDEHGHSESNGVAMVTWSPEYDQPANNEETGDDDNDNENSDEDVVEMVDSPDDF